MNGENVALSPVTLDGERFLWVVLTDPAQPSPLRVRHGHARTGQAREHYNLSEIFAERQRELDRPAPQPVYRVSAREEDGKYTYERVTGRAAALVVYEQYKVRFPDAELFCVSA